MRGQQWEPAEGTIVDVQSRHHEHHYTIDFRTGQGVLHRRRVKHRSPTAYAIGTKVRIEFDQHNEIRFDQNSPGGDPVISTMTMSDQIREASEAFDHPGVAGPNFGGFGGPGGAGFGGAGFGVGAAGGLAGLISELAGSFGGMQGGMTAGVIGPGGQQLPFDPAEMSKLTQALMSGDKDARRAAVQRLQQIRAQARGGMSGQLLGPGVMGPAGGFGAPTGPGGFDAGSSFNPGGASFDPGGSSFDPGGSSFDPGGSSFDPGGSSFDQVSSPVSDGSMSGAGAYGTDSRGTVEERLAKLQQLLGQGIVTQSEYEIQRQRIIEGI